MHLTCAHWATADPTRSDDILGFATICDPASGMILRDIKLIMDERHKAPRIIPPKVMSFVSPLAYWNYSRAVTAAIRAAFPDALPPPMPEPLHKSEEAVEDENTGSEIAWIRRHAR